MTRFREVDAPSTSFALAAPLDSPVLLKASVKTIRGTSIASSSGYSPDLDESSSTIDYDSESSEDIETEIKFLQEKAHILKQVIVKMKQADIFDASQARHIIEQAKEPTQSSSIWAEAKEILDIMDNEPDNGYVGGAARQTIPISSNQTPSIVNTTATEQTATFIPAEAETERAAKRPRIDTRSVVCLTSKNTSPENRIPLSSATPKPKEFPFFPAGLWKAILPSSSPKVASTKTNWKVIVDPNHGASVVPSSDCKQISILKNAIRLQDAVNFTPIPQVVALSSPPYSVVHANRAFFLLHTPTSDNSGSSSNNSMIGQPMDSILQISGTLDDEQVGSKRCTPSDNNLVHGCLLIPNSGRGGDCQLEVTPIQNRTGISHFLVKVFPPMSDIPIVSQGCSNESKSLPALETASGDDSGDTDSLYSFEETAEEEGTDAFLQTVG